MATAKQAYTTGKRYLFKTGFNSYVSGILTTVYDSELDVAQAQLQIPPDKISKFLAEGKELFPGSIHPQMILPRENIDWAVPIK